MSKMTKRTRTAGQPTKFRQAFIVEAEKVCEQEGYTDKQLAKHLKVSVGTINNWKCSHPDFAAAVREGKGRFDTEVVQEHLLKRARGYEYNEETWRANAKGEQVLKKTVLKHVPSDITAIIFWLKNRNPERWSNKHSLNHNFTLADFMKLAAKGDTQG